ncbi:MAG: HpcH/HpaI aldolase/citrate lyase family protein [Oscillospiraceae bacterium]|nr:HpcH/HpaI aldolase/citrate lyase family protein [Oscillospiraceae bacterium]
METNKEILAFRVGSVLYTPAINEGIAEKILANEYDCLCSMAFCLEDAIMEVALEQAEQQLADTLRILLESGRTSEELPLLFVRVRNPRHLELVSRKLDPFREILTGYILPKFDMVNAGAYLSVMNGINRRSDTLLYAMPILESAVIADKTSRMQELSRMHSLLMAHRDIILNVRVGGNDFCNLYGLRRTSSQTIYDISFIRDILSDIIGTFGRDFVVSAPVWEYFGNDDADQWAKGLRAELELDRLNGFIGKTAVHPTQLPLIYQSLQVSRTDAADADAILDWQDAAFAVGKSGDGSRMNEVKCHGNWARKIRILSEIYGIREDADEKLV